MEVNPGYRQTEIGVIPEDWIVASLGDIAITSSGTTPARALGERYYRDGTVHWVKTLDLNNSILSDTDEKVTKLAIDETSLRSYPAGSVLVAMYGGFNQIGRTGLISMPAAVNQAITAIQPHANKLHSEYLLAALNFRIDYWKSVASSSRKDPNITSQDVRSFPVALPILAEQRAIAAALSDVDALLESLDRLIAKKRNLKQAAMQQLLTGQTRLPGFSGEWELKRLGDIATYFSGGTPSTDVSSNYGGQIPWITSGDLNQGYIVDVQGRITDAGLANSSAKLVEPGALLIALYGATSGVAAISRVRAAINQAVLAILPRQDNVYFIYFKLIFLKNWVISTYTQGGQPNLSGEIVKSIEMRLPQISEQDAIADVLTDMDYELASIEQRRNKTAALKQAMMQELLTGRTRLV